MNALSELLAAATQPSTEEIRAAAAASLAVLKHDRRVEVLSLAEVTEIAVRLFHTPDIRNLERQTRPYDEERLETDLKEVNSYTDRMTFEVVHQQSLLDPSLRAIQRAFRSRGAQMRVAAVPFRAHIYDRRFALVPRDFDDNTAGAYAVHEPDLVRSLVELHTRLWRQGERWIDPEGGSRSTSPDLADVLGELLDGATDEAAANRLQISVRTYRRRVHDLLRLLGTTSRFEAGAIAQERGYLDLLQGVATAAPETSVFLTRVGEVRV